MTEAMSHNGRRVVVIGGSSGIGFAVAALSLKMGAAVVNASSNAATVDTGRRASERNGRQCDRSSRRNQRRSLL
jgi:NAD(P)-dependent dehydrogenase (short-subunit alcohol dehydrogenase family)